MTILHDHLLALLHSGHEVAFESTEAGDFAVHVTRDADGETWTAVEPEIARALWTASPLHGDDEPFPGRAAVRPVHHLRAHPGGAPARGQRDAGGPVVTGPDEDLAYLAWHWEGAYAVSHPEPGVWLAQRLDDRAVLRAASAGELRDAIIADYTARPVPR